jgi:hypothetical protein
LIWLWQLLSSCFSSVSFFSSSSSIFER